MFSLHGSSERAVYQAMFELLDGGLVHRVDGEISVEAEEGRYRFMDGVCFAGPTPECVGASLAGWLVESERASAVLTRWRRGARAVLARDGASPRVTGETAALTALGALVEDGFATHAGRLVFAHDSAAPRAPSADPVIEIHRDVPDLDELETVTATTITLAEVAKLAARVTPDEPDPPSVRAEPVEVTEPAGAAASCDEPDDTEPPTQPGRPRSHAAPPAWAMSRLPTIEPLPAFAFPVELLDGFDDDLDTAPGRTLG